MSSDISLFAGFESPVILYKYFRTAVLCRLLLNYLFGCVFRLTPRRVGGRFKVSAILKSSPGIFIYRMNVGVCKVYLRLPENMSLKGKRQVLKSVISRIRNKFNVAVAEVDDNDVWQRATIGICCVSNNNRHTNQVLSRVVDFVVGARFDVEILDYEIEIIGV